MRHQRLLQGRKYWYSYTPNNVEDLPLVASLLRLNRSQEYRALYRYKAEYHLS